MSSLISSPTLPGCLPVEPRRLPSHSGLTPRNCTESPAGPGISVRVLGTSQMLRTTDTWFVSVVAQWILAVRKRLPWEGRRITVTWRADLGELSDNALLARLRPLPPDSAERAAICEVL